MVFVMCGLVWQQDLCNQEFHLEWKIETHLELESHPPHLPPQGNLSWSGPHRRHEEPTVSWSEQEQASCQWCHHCNLTAHVFCHRLDMQQL